MGDDRLDLPQGTLDLLILKALAAGPLHGWAISERLHQVSKATLQVPQGSLYPALHRLERQGWIAAEWGASDNNRRAKYYELTRAGRRQLADETASWERLAKAVRLVLAME
ncbi:MAG: PadR family transcriptional regulator [Vicinamibacterales bacterium]|jgi:transcriptional regulator